MIQKAYEVAREAHKDQKRKSGEPYIIHPLCVAIILADLELDKETIVAGLLLDAVEDTWMTIEEVEKENNFDYFTAKFFYQLNCSFHRTTGCDQVINDCYFLSWFDRVFVHQIRRK